MTRSSSPRATPGVPDSTPAYLPFAGYPPALVEAALDRIVGSGTFRRSQRHQLFLRHVVRAALDGRQEELKEIVIGLEVFSRDIAAYDPRRDPIVRVEAGRVRDKLARYYADEGLADAFEIQIPVGGYLPQLSRRAAAKSVPKSLGAFAVLSFASLSSDPDDAFFCEALADQLIDRLSRLPGTRVVGRTSATKARAKSADVKAVGRMLGVTHVIEGSVQRAGRRLRCIAQIIRARDRLCAWSERFECEVGGNADLFAFQDRVADTVVAAVVDPDDPAARSAATPGSRPPPPRDPVGDATARDLYERARYLVQLRTNDTLAKGIALLQRSIALDPGFAPAHSQLGIAKSAFYGIMARPTLSSFREVEEHARRALELDAQDGDARALIANIAFRVDRDWARAEPLFREALRIAPNSASAHQSYAGGLVFNGRYVEALQHARIALDLDPLNVTVRIQLAVITAYARDLPTAIDEFKSVLDIEPDHFYAHIMIGSFYLWSGLGEPAMRHFEHACRAAPDHPIPQFDKIFVYGLDGERERGRAALGALLARLEGTNYQLYNRAMAEAYLGEVPAMYETLRRSAAAHELLFVTLPADPSFDPYRDEPEFIALMHEFGLPRLPPSPFASAYPLAA